MYRATRNKLQAVATDTQIDDKFIKTELGDYEVISSSNQFSEAIFVKQEEPDELNVVQVKYLAADATGKPPADNNPTRYEVPNLDCPSPTCILFFQ